MKLLKKSIEFAKSMPIITAILLLSLGVFGVSNPSWVSSINIAVLTLITISLLGNRYRIENIQQRITQSSHGVFQERFPDDFMEP